MKFVVGFTSTSIGCVILLWLLLPCPVADASDTLTLIYSGEEQGELGLHGCGGRASRWVFSAPDRHPVVAPKTREHPKS